MGRLLLIKAIAKGTASGCLQAQGDAVRNLPSREILGGQQLSVSPALKGSVLPWGRMKLQWQVQALSPRPAAPQWIRATTKDSLAAGTTWQLYGALTDWCDVWHARCAQAQWQCADAYNCCHQPHAPPFCFPPGQGTVMLDQWAPDLEAAAAQAPPGKRQLWSAVLANLTGPGAATTTVYTKARSVGAPLLIAVVGPEARARPGWAPTAAVPGRRPASLPACRLPTGPTCGACSSLSGAQPALAHLASGLLPPVPPAGFCRPVQTSVAPARLAHCSAAIQSFARIVVALARYRINFNFDGGASRKFVLHTANAAWRPGRSVCCSGPLPPSHCSPCCPPCHCPVQAGWATKRRRLAS